MKKVGILICLLLILPLSFCKNYENQEDQLKVSQKQVEDKEVPILKYRIIQKKDISYENSSRLVYRVMLDVVDFPSEVDIKNTASYIWKNGNTHWDDFTVFLYLPEMNTEGEAFCVSEFCQTGQKRFSVQMSALSTTKWANIVEQKNKMLGEMASQKKKEIENSIGPIKLSVELKKKIYREFISDPLMALDDGSDKIILKLGEKYMKKYNLSRLELAAIMAEGAEKGW